MSKFPRYSRHVIGAVLVAALCIVATSLITSQSSKHVVAYFKNTTSLYEGDYVNVLGVKVGTVDKIVPEGDRVRVEMTYDSDIDIPADAEAAIIAPTLVSGRYVQFAPVYVDGPVLADGAVVSIERTAVPVSFDESKAQLDALVKQLAPNDMNRDGTLAELVNSAAGALDGRGQLVNGTLTGLSAAAATLESGAPDLFGAIRNLQVFIATLAANDREIVGFSNQLSSVSNLLNNNRTELDALLNSLSTQMESIRTFVGDNREKLVADVTELQRITQLAVNREDDLAQILHSGPTALTDFYNIYDPQTKSLTGALALPDLPDGRSLICALATTVNAPQDMCATASRSLMEQVAAGALDGKPMPAIPDLPTLLAPLTGATR